MTNDQDLRAALAQTCARAISDANITNCRADEALPVVDAMLAALSALTAPPRPDHAGGVDKKRLSDAIDSAIDSLRFYHADGIADALDVAADNYLNITPAQAPDKAAEREGVDRSIPALRLRQDPPNGDAGLIEDYERAALAPKPTGTEAGRGVGAEFRIPERLVHRAYEHFQRGAEFTCSASAMREAISLVFRALDATPTPPPPDSTAQGDGTSQEGL